LSFRHTAAKEDYLHYLSQVEGPKGIHLCGNPDWSFLIAWGITPTLTEELNRGSLETLAKKLEEMFAYIAQHSLDMDEILDRAWLAPSCCCLVNADKTISVNKSFEILKALGEYV